MPMNAGIVLSNTSLVQAGSNVSEPRQWNGNNAVFVMAAQQWAPSVTIQYIGVGNQSVNVQINSGNISQNGILHLWVPAGSIQVHSSGGSSIGLYMGLFPVS